jgi:hypothetical protein
MGLPLHETATLLRAELLASRRTETPAAPASRPTPDDAR